MRRRIYVDGKPAWTENEPSYARRQGHGGAAMGAFSGVRLTVHEQRRRKTPARAPLNRKPAA